MQKELITLNEAAEMLSVSTVTVKRLLNKGQLVAVKIGSRSLIRHGDLLAWIDTLPKREVSHVAA
jgi:excisionase family DNA binding protein